MSNFRVNSFLQHSTPEYNAKHKKENSEYNAKYYQAHKEKWGVKDSGSSSESSDSDDEDDKKKKKKKEENPRAYLDKLNGGSKAISKKKEKSEKKSSEKSSKKKETDEEKAERLRKQKEEKERKAEETRKANEEYAAQLKKVQEQMAERQNGVKKKKVNVTKSNPYVKHSYIVNPSSEFYLMHHGIDNQRWGVRHGPPYPLAREISSAIKKGASEGLSQGGKQVKNYAIQNTIRPATDRIQKKKNPQKFDAKRIAKTSAVMIGSAVAAGVLSKLVDFGIDKAVRGGKIAAGTLLSQSSNEGISNWGVNILLDAYRKN